MASTRHALLSTLTSVLDDVTTGSPTALGRHMTDDLTRRNASEFTGVGGPDHPNSYNMSTSLMTDSDKSEDIPAWLSVRLVIVVCVVVGLVCLTLASYSLHKRCCSDQTKYRYRKTLLI